MRPSEICLIAADDLLAERRELRIDHAARRRARQHADRAALPFEGVEISRDLRGLDLHLAEVRLLRTGFHRSQRDNRRQYNRVSHVRSVN
jgi:hypothetical protein